jgi:hypothetical protein
MPRYQPDPLLREGRRSRSWTWIMGAVVVVIIALTFIALNQGRQTTAQQQGPNQPATTGAGPSAQPVPPSPGRGNADAPRETPGKTVR